MFKSRSTEAIRKPTPRTTHNGTRFQVLCTPALAWNAWLRIHNLGGEEIVSRICRVIDGHECTCSAIYHSLLVVRVPVPQSIGGERGLPRAIERLAIARYTVGGLDQPEVVGSVGDGILKHHIRNQLS